MVNKVRDDFPVLQKKVHGTPLIYLDNAATMQMPLCVMHAMREQVQQYHANVHRGMHYLSELSTARLESVRETVRAFIGAGSAREIIFTSGTTAAINIAAASLAKCWFRPGDRIFATAMEHHSNYLPWFEAAASADAVFVEVPFDDSGNLDVGLLERMFSEHTRLVAVTMVSNVLGTVNPVREIIQTAHRHHALVLVDAAQAMQHEKINVKELDCASILFLFV